MTAPINEVTQQSLSYEKDQISIKNPSNHIQNLEIQNQSTIIQLEVPAVINQQSLDADQHPDISKPNGETSLQVIKMGAGGDDQSHVSDPYIKYNMQMFNNTQKHTLKRDMRYLLSKNLSKQDLEPIQE